MLEKTTHKLRLMRKKAGKKGKRDMLNSLIHDLSRTNRPVEARDKIDLQHHLAVKY